MAKKKTSKKVITKGSKRQLLIGMYDVFDPAGGSTIIGMVAVKGRAGGGQFDNTEHWAFLKTYRGPGINETLRVLRRTAGEPTPAQWQVWLNFLRADPLNIYILADCTQRAHPA